MGTNLERVAAAAPSDFAPPIARLLGLKAVAFEPGVSTFEMETGPHLANPMGTLHGGVLCDLADLAMGSAYWGTLAEGESFTTLELKINFMKPVWTGKLTAVARVKKGGKTTGLVECEIRDAGGSLVAYTTSTCMTLRGEKAKGR